MLIYHITYNAIVYTHARLYKHSTVKVTQEITQLRSCTR